MENSPQKEDGWLTTVPAVAEHEDLRSDPWQPQKIQCWSYVSNPSTEDIPRACYWSLLTSPWALGSKERIGLWTHMNMCTFTSHKHTHECSQRTLAHWLLVCFPTPFCFVVIVCMYEAETCVCVSHRSWFFTFIWDLGIEPWSLGLLQSKLACWAVSAAPAVHIVGWSTQPWVAELQENPNPPSLMFPLWKVVV